MNEPVRIFSDLHLGHKVSRIRSVESLRPLISGAGTVIFNGDTWQELAKCFFTRSAEMLAELKSLCREEGANPVFLSGNHDPGWSGPGWISLANGKIIITHGDALLFDGSPWKREILIHGQRVMDLWNQYPNADENIEQRLRLARAIARELPSVEHSVGRSIFRRALDAILPPKRAVKMIEAWLTQGREGAKFCDNYFPNAELLIIGHFHHQGSWLRNSRRIINTGSFMAPGRAQWIEYQDGWLRYGEIDESAENCSFGKTHDVWRF